MPCSGDSSETCGGTWANSIYAVGYPIDYEKENSSSAEVNEADPFVNQLAEIALNLSASTLISSYLLSGEFANDARNNRTSTVRNKLSVELDEDDLRSIGGPYHTLTVGLVISGGLAVGLSTEIGIAIPLIPGEEAYFYHAYAIDGGLIQDVSMSIALGLHESGPDELCGEQKAFSAGLSTPGAPITISGGYATGVLEQSAGLLSDGKVVTVFASVGLGVELTDALTFGLAPAASFQSSSTITTVPASNASACSCGAENQRPCTIVERIPSCDEGLFENFLTHACEPRGNIEDRPGPGDPIELPVIVQDNTLTFYNKSRFPAYFTIWDVNYDLADGANDTVTTGQVGDAAKKSITLPGDATINWVKVKYLDAWSWKHLNTYTLNERVDDIDKICFEVSGQVGSPEHERISCPTTRRVPNPAINH